MTYYMMDKQYINGHSFLAVPHNLALMLNIDWFCPYKHSPYSVGAIYLTYLDQRGLKEKM